VVVGGAAFGAWTVLNKRDVATTVPQTVAQPTSCPDPTTVRVAVAPVIAPAVAAAAQALSTHADGPCAAYSIEPAEAFAVAGSLVSGRPDAWITDSTYWLGRAAAVSGSSIQTDPAFASSPLVVAMPTETAASLGDKRRWADLLTGSTPLRIPDPNRSATGRMALGAAAATMPEQQLRTVVTAAAPRSATTITLDGLAQSKPATGAVVVEAQLIAFNAAHSEDQLAAVAPAEGSAAIDYSLATLTKDNAVAPLVKALGDYLSSGEARKVLQDSGFRTPDGTEPKAPSPLYGEVTVTGPPKDEVATQAARLWNAAAPKVQALLAVDVSGSMLERGDNGTRLSIVQRSTVRATAAVSTTTIASLWIYSLHVGNRADDYKQLLDYGGLGVSKHLGDLDRAVSGLDKSVGGGSGLYDTIAAAYSRAQSAWKPGYTNTVIVVADGPNEDDYGLTLDLLKKQLAQSKNAAKPVRLVVLGIGDRADAAAMGQVVGITGGQYVPTQSVDDLGPALIKALGG
jgi:ABC-type molybdate transport system substrate-binding protein